jgi:hypothetical protein
MYFYLGVTTMLTEDNHLCAVVIHILHSLVEKNELTLEFYVQSQMFCNVEFHVVFHSSSPTIFTAETLHEVQWHILHLYMC